jgi:cyanophycinase
MNRVICAIVQGVAKAGHAALLCCALCANAAGPDAAEPADVMLLAGGALPLCSSVAPAQCLVSAPIGRRDTPKKFVADRSGARLREIVSFNASKNTASTSIYLHFVAMARAAHRARTGKQIDRPTIAYLTSASVDPYDAVDFYQGAFEQAGAEAIWLPLDAAVRESFGGHCNKIGLVRKRITEAPDRSAIYPDLADTQLKFCQDRTRLAAILSQSDGLFFNGGDQHLSKAAWFSADQPIAEFALLQKRLQLGHLAVGGTSAGTAVMSTGAMITNGVSAVALKRGAQAVPPPPLGCTEKRNCPQGLLEDDLTFDAKGGLGLFAPGVLDTHFAARDRQGRLARLLIDSKARFGFGVDETTALLVAHPNKRLRLRALGAGQVWIFDAKDRTNAATLARQSSALKPGETLFWSSKNH